MMSASLVSDICKKCSQPRVLQFAIGVQSYYSRHASLRTKASYDIFINGNQHIYNIYSINFQSAIC